MNEENLSSRGPAIKARLEASGITIARVAAEAGVSRQSVYDAIGGRAEASTLAALEAALDWLNAAKPDESGVANRAFLLGMLAQTLSASPDFDFDAVNPDEGWMDISARGGHRLRLQIQVHG